MTKNKKQRRESEAEALRGSAVRYIIPQGILHLDHRLGVFCAFWSADLQSILDVRICSSALSAREYQCSGCRRSDGLGREHLGKWRHGKQRSSQGFCTPYMDFTFFIIFFIIFSFLSFSPHTSILPHTFSPRNTSCTTFHTVGRGGSAGSPLSGRPGPAWGHEVSSLEYHK